jgi:hypothetical protein
MDGSNLLPRLIEVREHYRWGEDGTSSLDIAIPDLRRRILSVVSCRLRIEDFKLMNYLIVAALAVLSRQNVSSLDHRWIIVGWIEPVAEGGCAIDCALPTLWE